MILNLNEFSASLIADYRHWWRLCVFVLLLGLIACGGGSAPSTTNGGGGDGGGGGGGTGVVTAGRTKYVRTDATTEYSQWINSHWIVYSPLTNRFYVTDPGSNHIMVMDAKSEAEVGLIGVPEAYSIDETADHRTLYVGTAIGDVYTIDPVAMKVTRRYVASQIGDNGFAALSALVLADGQLALLGEQGGIPSVDGSTNIAVWNPETNAITVYPSQGVPLPCGPMENIGGFSRTADRRKVIIASIDSDSTLCEIDARTGNGIFVNTNAAFTQVNFRTTPDGKYIVVPTGTGAPSGGNADVYDVTTLKLIKQIPVAGDISTASGFAISADSKTLFAPDMTIIYAYDLATGNQTGWLPNMDVQTLGGGGAFGPITGPDLQAVDGTGLFAGPLEEGVGFIDTTTMRTGAVGSQFTNGYLTPPTGPTSGGTQVQIEEPNQFAAVGAVYFGSHEATNVSGTAGSVSVTTPAGKAGASDFYLFTTDGGMQLIPEGFSYGPTILEVTPGRATGEGGGTGMIYGYGFGPLDSDNVPSSLHVSVGGNPARVTAFMPYAYPFGAPPFLLQALTYTIPPGDNAADVTVTSRSGSATAKAALSYLPPIQQFPLPGAELAQGIYDPYTDLYYFTDTDKIQVFSRALGSWQPPINIPPPQGQAQRLWGIALSPDGTKMAIGDTLAQVVYLLDPSNPSTVQTFPVPTIPPSNGAITDAFGVAISDAGIIYYIAYVQGGSGYNIFFKLDTTTGIVTPYTKIQGFGAPTDVYMRTELSPDNSAVFFNEEGVMWRIDTATDEPVFAAVEPGCCYGDYELALSGDGTRLEASGYLYDPNLAAESGYALNDREILNIEYVYGAKLSADGNLLFQPSTNGIDVLDGRLGNLLTRISLPIALSPEYDALVADGKDNVLVAITGTNADGIAIVDLSSIKEPPALGYESESDSKLNHASRTFRDSGIRVRSYRGRPNRASLQRTVPHVTKSIPRRSSNRSLH